jgi:hypothetical protein
VRRGAITARLLAIAPTLAMMALVTASAAILAGCATTVQQEIAKMPRSSLQKLSYYPFQVKGYQNSYPHKRILVLMPVVTRKSAEQSSDNPATGVVLAPSGAVVQHIYSQPLPRLFQQAIVKSAEEAGMVAKASNEPLDTALKQVGENYILTSKITRCWVKKHSGTYPGSNGSASPMWFTTANVSLNVSIYKPPFNVPFWQGVSANTYNDPPADNGSGMSDEIPIYSHPGQVLSVALTRAVAEIFKREALHALVIQDTIHPRLSN